MLEDISRKEPVTQCNSISSESVSDTKGLSFSYLSILVSACTLEVHLRGCLLSHALQHPCDTWQHSCFTITLCTLCSTSASLSLFCLCAAQCLSLVDTLQILLLNPLIPVDPALACRSLLSKVPVFSPCSCDRQLFLILLLPY